MNIHEFQAKEVLKKYGIPMPDFGVASNGKGVDKVIQELGLTEAVVKIQVQKANAVRPRKRLVARFQETLRQDDHGARRIEKHS